VDLRRNAPGLVLLENETLPTAAVAYAPARMNVSSRPLFGGRSRFVAWILVPPLGLFAVWLPFAIPKWTAGAVALFAALESAAILLALTLTNPERFRTIGRVLAAEVFLSYSAYAVYELLYSTGPFFGKSRGDPAPGNALLGLLILGVPALLYAIRGRFGREE
jgi:hypothetical protein